MSATTTTHYRTCHLCEAMCGLAIRVQDGQVVDIRGDEQDVHSRGHICPKAIALQDIHTDPDRLRQPQRRTARGWETVAWEEAFDEAAARIRAIQDRYGRDAVAVYTGNPTVHNTGTILYLYDFLQALGTRNRFASHSLDQLPQMVVSGELFGHQALFPVPDLERTDYFLILGANPLVSNGSIMSTPHIGRRLRGIRQRGGKVVVIDPRRTRTARAADEHFFIRPGSDVLFLLALTHTLFEEDLVRKNHVWDFTDGIQALRQAVAAYPPDRVADATGIEASDIRRLARELATAEAAVCYGRMGVSTQTYGTLCQWLLTALNLLTGNLDRTGGALFSRPAVDFLNLLKKEAKARRWSSRVRNLPETAGDLPTATLADEILTPGKGQIKALITIAGNPVLSAPNAGRMEEALSQLDYMVAIDIYRNETTRHANLILPPAAGLEVLHYDFVLNIVAPRNIVNYSEPVFPIDEGQRYDWQILFELQKRLDRNPLAALKHFFLKNLTPERRIDLGLRTGPYGMWGGRFLKKEGLSLSLLKEHPHGVDLGPLQPSLPGRLFTTNQRIDLAPGLLLNEIPKVEALLAGALPGELLLIGRRHLHSNNSWMHNYPRLMKQNGRCTAQLHPETARARGIADGQTIRLTSRTGSVEIPAELTEDIRPGVVSIPHGWGHHGEGLGLELAARHPGVNVNILTDEQVIDTASGNAVFNGVPITIHPI